MDSFAAGAQTEKKSFLCAAHLTRLKRSVNLNEDDFDDDEDEEEENIIEGKKCLLDNTRGAEKLSTRFSSQNIIK